MTIITNPCFFAFTLPLSSNPISHQLSHRERFVFTFFFNFSLFMHIIRMRNWSVVQVPMQTKKEQESSLEPNIIHEIVVSTSPNMFNMQQGTVV